MTEIGSFDVDLCIVEGCHLASAIPQETLKCLARLGLERCPGLATDGSHRVCSLPGEIADAVLADQPDAPVDVVLDAGWAIAENRLDPERLPVGDAFLYQMPSNARWQIIEQALPTKQVT